MEDLRYVAGRLGWSEDFLEFEIGDGAHDSV